MSPLLLKMGLPSANKVQIPKKAPAGPWLRVPSIGPFKMSQACAESNRHVSPVVCAQCMPVRSVSDSIPPCSDVMQTLAAIISRDQGSRRLWSQTPELPSTGCKNQESDGENAWLSLEQRDDWFRS